MTLQDFLKATGDFLTTAAHKIAVWFHPLLDQVEKDLGPALEQIGAAALAAAVQAAQAPSDLSKSEAAYQAAKGAATTVAVQLGVAEVGTLANTLRAVALKSAIQATQEPPPVNQ